MRTLTLLLLCLLLTACKHGTETLDWSARPFPDAISQPVGRYPLATTITTQLQPGIQPSTGLTLPDGLAKLADGTLATPLADAADYARQFCLPIQLQDTAALVTVRLYYGPYPRRGSMYTKSPQLWTDRLQPDDLLVQYFDSASALRQAAAAAEPPAAASGYSGLCQLAARGDTLLGANVWINTASLQDFREQAQRLYPDPVLATAWALAQWDSWLRLVLPHELAHAWAGLRDEPYRTGPGMMHYRQMTRVFNAAEAATLNWLRKCKAMSIVITAEDW